jgi:hypothetical protein
MSSCVVTAAAVESGRELGADLREGRPARDLDPPALVVGEMEVEAVQLVAGSQVDPPEEVMLVEEGPAHVDHESAPREARMVGDLHAGDLGGPRGVVPWEELRQRLAAVEKPGGSGGADEDAAGVDDDLVRLGAREVTGVFLGDLKGRVIRRAGGDRRFAERMEDRLEETGRVARLLRCGIVEDDLGFGGEAELSFAQLEPRGTGDEGRLLGAGRPDGEEQGEASDRSGAPHRSRPPSRLRPIYPDTSTRSMPLRERVPHHHVGTSRCAATAHFRRRFLRSNLNNIRFTVDLASGIKLSESRGVRKRMSNRRNPATSRFRISSPLARVR